MQNNNQEAGLNYTNLPTMDTTGIAQASAKSTGAIKKIPENLKLRSDDKINNNSEELSIYRASGPYIPLSDCFSGSPVLFVSFLNRSLFKSENKVCFNQKSENDPKTPLNSLDPKFYDTPRSHITSIGLNLTDDQPNSPKRNNTQAPSMAASKSSRIVTRSNNSSPTDSEGESTDEGELNYKLKAYYFVLIKYIFKDWTEPKVGSSRKSRPSDSSMENESIAITAGQSYMKICGNPIPLPPKRISLVLEKKPETSDTEENASPLMQIGPKDSSSYVIDDRYDFPRSYNVQGFTGSHMNIGTISSMASIHGNSHLMTSTPNLIQSVSTIDCSKINFYSNAAPRENNIFRFDFTSSAPPPEINRSTKPRKEHNGQVLRNVQPAPTVNRKLKPGTLTKVIINHILSMIIVSIL